MWCAAATCLAAFGLSNLAFAQGVSQEEVAQVKQFVQQIDQQWGPQFRQIHKAELHFMRLVCQPTKQQFEKIAAESQPALKSAIRKFGENMQHGRAMRGTEPRALITEALSKSVRTVLSPEQATRYQKELDQRAAAQKRVSLQNLTARVDGVLLLQTEQRVKLGRVLESKWSDSWNNTQMFMNGGEYFPRMPDAEILPILTETQKAVWRKVQKNVGFGFDVGGGGLQMDEEVWDEPQPQKKPERRDGKAAVNVKKAAQPYEKE
jgi:hypothetical protein